MLQATAQRLLSPQQVSWETFNSKSCLKSWDALTHTQLTSMQWLKCFIFHKQRHRLIEKKKTSFLKMWQLFILIQQRPDIPNAKLVAGKARHGPREVGFSLVSLLFSLARHLPSIRYRACACGCWNGTWVGYHYWITEDVRPLMHRHQYIFSALSVSIPCSPFFYMRLYLIGCDWKNEFKPVASNGIQLSR